jgi:hypothetical protein
MLQLFTNWENVLIKVLHNAITKQLPMAFPFAVNDNTLCHQIG